MRTRTARLNPYLFLGALALAALPFKAHADAHGELVTATTHADLAGKAGDLNGVHMHLHHAVNCLVGPNGTGFDSKEMDPCANAGNGVIPDTTDAAKKTKLQAAVKTAEAGIAEADLAKAKAKATAAAAELKALQ